MAETVELTKDGQIAVLTLSRPEAYNAIDLDTAEHLANCLMSLSVDNSVRGVVLTGKGKAFCAGGDLKWMLGFPQGPSAAVHTLAAHAHQAVLEIRRMKKPVIAAVNGVAAGAGFSVALACDFRVMARSAVLQLAYPSAGLCVDGGGTFMLPRIVGLARALEITAYDRPISSEQALSWGLATKVVEDGHALEEALNMARDLAERSLSSFGWSKQLLTDSFNTSFETHLEREREGIRSCAAHADGQEGISAFIEKRKPVFNVK
ncbi:MAG: enoyl-CoA hydratase/isomerase family protein [Dehalococcoidia bacterium]